MLNLEETQKLKVIPLGGLGEIGKNMTAIEYADELIVIDCELPSQMKACMGLI